MVFELVVVGDHDDGRIHRMKVEVFAFLVRRFGWTIGSVHMHAGKSLKKGSKDA